MFLSRDFVLYLARAAGSCPVEYMRWSLSEIRGLPVKRTGRTVRQSCEVGETGQGHGGPVNTEMDALPRVYRTDEICIGGHFPQTAQSSLKTGHDRAPSEQEKAARRRPLRQSEPGGVRSSFQTASPGPAVACRARVRGSAGLTAPAPVLPLPSPAHLLWKIAALTAVPSNHVHVDAVVFGSVLGGRMDNGAAKPEISSGGGGGGWRGHRILGAGPEVTEGGDAPSGRKARPTDGGRLRIQAGRGRRRGLFAREQQPIQAQWHPPDASISSRDAASGRARGRQRAENGRRGTGQGQGEGESAQRAERMMTVGRD
ncbi:hypothetical protein Mp_7g17620 [Marchantia polymorpha subsp. ruderalis]|uniref:Uncharacterized protein n=2 Tax=Marchantia polymorpha TaxID=3197 RepID=A0AAF6C0U1_MARPO|nr:hypothetical protein MARPO_0051s0099 [Marchantia polymorpha]BBN17875.1 hypothetical protein Mp_7g17620 [Marchantia polymorpha subsp. ruderalis]|eukprot:PTQ38500.1 hypothetical protein MARPO_0051s0099 [Marchantia polymorpha]